MQFTQCNSLSKNRTLLLSSARHRALSSSARLKLDTGRACSKISLFKPYMDESKKFTFEHSDEEKFGGADRDRTDDPLLAKQVLSQLSYSPNDGGPG